jgi:hypothetical protein
MKLTSITTTPRHLSFLDIPKVLPSSSATPNYIIIDDKYAKHDKIVEKKGIYWTLSDFDINDEEYPEISSHLKGLYVVADDLSKTGAVEVSATACILTASSAGIIDTNSKYLFKAKFNGLYTVRIALTKGLLDVDAIVEILNNNSEFSKYAVASKDGGSGKLVLTTKAKGANADIEYLMDEFICVDVNLSDGVKTAATKAVVTLTANVLNSVGEGFPGIDVTFKLYDALEDGSAASDIVCQRVSTGTAVSGEYTNTIKVTSGAGGVIKFEIVQTGDTIADTWIAVELPATHVFATKPTSRFQVAAAA